MIMYPNTRVCKYVFLRTINALIIDYTNRYKNVNN